MIHRISLVYSMQAKQYIRLNNIKTSGKDLTSKTYSSAYPHPVNLASVHSSVAIFGVISTFLCVVGSVCLVLVLLLST